MCIMTTAHQLSAPELHAIKILAKEADEKRALLVPGKIPLDFGLHITGDLIVNANTDARQRPRPRPSTWSRRYSVNSDRASDRRSWNRSSTKVSRNRSSMRSRLWPSHSR